MADAALAHNVFPLHALTQWGRTLPRGADMLTGGIPCYGVYATQDGRFLAVGALEEKFWRRLCATIDRPDLAPLAFALGDEGERVRRELALVFGAQPLAHWVETFAPVDCCVTPIATLEEALADPQFAARGMVVAQPDGSRQYAPPFKVSGHEFAVAREAPAQGQHTTEVLREAGYDDAAIAALRTDGAIAG
jgi:crotonobetainyl-CoA:carnitine CoA-transferase CaiB-like acyl-CoA transferase